MRGNGEDSEPRAEPQPTYAPSEAAMQRTNPRRSLAGQIPSGQGDFCLWLLLALSTRTRYWEIRAKQQRFALREGQEDADLA